MSGVWSAGGNLATARYGLAGAGTQTAGLCMGGITTVNVAVAEEYDGAAWLAGGNLATARRYLSGAGTQTAGLCMGGYTSANVAVTEEYDGAAWLAGGNLATARRALSSAGTQTAGLCMGGYTTINVAATEEYNGVSLADTALNLSAYYQKLLDFETYLRAHDGIELHDLNAELSAWGLAVEDLASWMAAYYESIEDFGISLETWATGYKNFPGEFDAKGQKIEVFMAYLAAAKNKFKDLAMLLHAVNGSVLNDMGVSLAATNGIVAKDLGMFLQALSAVPVFRSVTAHRIDSVIHEVV